MSVLSWTERTIASPTTATCPQCSLAYEGTPNQCPRCGAPLRVTADELHRLGQAKRSLLWNRKTLADALFLAGLLVGGPMMSSGGQIRNGALVVLAGAIASVLRRYTEWSTLGTVVVGALLALVTASAFSGPIASMTSLASAGEDQRSAYAQALADKDPDILVEARGPGLIALWYTLPNEMTGACGEYPGAQVQEHLAQLGFRRIVIVEPNGNGGLCSFAPRRTATSPPA